MAFFNLFLSFFTLLLAGTSIVLVYLAVDQCRESAFVPIYYFIGMALAASAILSISRMSMELFGKNFVLSAKIVQDLFLSYVVLFLFGSLWQSYEASLCVPEFVDSD